MTHLNVIYFSLKILFSKMIKYILISETANNITFTTVSITSTPLLCKCYDLHFLVSTENSMI